MKLKEVIDRRSRGFREFTAVIEIELSDVEEVKIKKSDFWLKGQELFDLIFSIDPETGLPSGDLALYMNENTSPEVRQYITENLMSDVSSAVAPSVQAKNAESIPDDMIAELSRHGGESLTDYRDRMIKFVQSQQSSDDSQRSDE